MRKLAKGTATLAQRKWASDVLTVLKHALFKAITIAAGGDDPDEGNKVHTRSPRGHVLKGPLIIVRARLYGQEKRAGRLIFDGI